LSQTFSNRTIPAVCRAGAGFRKPPVEHRGVGANFYAAITTALRGAANNAIPAVIMRLSCPACQTEYEVPDAALAGRARTLRCASCGHQWQSAPPSPPPAPPPLPPQLPLRGVFSDPVAELPPPPPVMASSRTAAPVSFVPEPVAGPPAASKRKFPIPDTPLDGARERVEPAAPPLTYANRGYQFENERPRQRRKRRANPLLVSILILLIAAIFVWIERVHVMHIWPPSIRLFNWINAQFAHKPP
jgi:predicted Zn finger-like uncharacterized protein